MTSKWFNCQLLWILRFRHRIDCLPLNKLKLPNWSFFPSKAKDGLHLSYPSTPLRKKRSLPKSFHHSNMKCQKNYHRGKVPSIE